MRPSAYTTILYFPFIHNHRLREVSSGPVSGGNNRTADVPRILHIVLLVYPALMDSGHHSYVSHPTVHNIPPPEPTCSHARPQHRCGCSSHRDSRYVSQSCPSCPLTGTDLSLVSYFSIIVGTTFPPPHPGHQARSEKPLVKDHALARSLPGWFYVVPYYLRSHKPSLSYSPFADLSRRWSTCLSSSQASACDFPSSSLLCSVLCSRNLSLSYLTGISGSRLPPVIVTTLGARPSGE